MSNLIVVEQNEVTFYEDQLSAVRGADGQIYVAVTQMCRALGLDERSQRRRIQNHNILTEGYTRGDISTPLLPMGVVAASNMPALYGSTIVAFHS